MDVSVSDKVQSLCEAHLRMVITASKKVNLTGITSFEQGKLLHIEDSLSALEELASSLDGTYIDIGSGAGYPGIPLALASERKTILVESVKKKSMLLESFISELCLEKKIQVFCGRVEECSVQKPVGCAVVTARALAGLASLLELAAPLLFQGGRLVCYKAQIDEEEVKHAALLSDKLGMRQISDRSFTLSDGITKRRIIVYERYKDPEVVLPRRIGLAQKRPF